MGIRTYDKWYQMPISAVRSANQELQENIRNNRNADFHVTEIVGVHTSSSYQFKFQDTGSGRAWAEGYINNPNGIGVIALPFRFPVPRVVKANASILYWLKDTSGSTNTLEIVLKGFLRSKFEIPGYEEPKKFDPNLTAGGRVKFPYAYIFDTTRASTALSEENIKVSSGHDFVVTHITGNMSDTNYYSLLIRDSGSNEYWSEAACRQDNFVGTAQYPFKLIRPRLVKAGSTIYFQITPSSAASNTIQIVLHGYEIPLKY